MPENSSGQKLFEKIKKEGVSPKPGWIFTVKNYLLWTGGVLFILVEGAAVSVVIYILRYSEWGVYERLTEGVGQFLLLVMPIFWLVLLAVLAWVIFFDIRHTKRGYRYPAYMVITAVLLVGLSLGVIFSYWGVGRYIDNTLSGNAPYYSEIINPRMDFWCAPEKGRLFGVVYSPLENKQFLLYGCEGSEWKVRVDRSKRSLQRDKNCVRYIDPGNSIRVIGKKVSGNGFVARDILLLRTGSRFPHRHEDAGHMRGGCPACVHR